MRKILFISVLAILSACSNNKKDDKSAAAETTNTDQPAPTTPVTTVPEPASPTKFTVEGKEINASGSLLVSKDKDKLQPGKEYFVMLTSSGGSNKESLTLNFLFDLKTGTNPVVGMSFTRGPSDTGEVYGGILGGQPKMTNFKVNITECTDLGSNNAGGHKWKISGTCEELIIPAMGIMLMDETKKHPKEIKIEKFSFSNLTFDDNWEEMLNKAMDQMKKK